MKILTTMKALLIKSGEKRYSVKESKDYQLSILLYFLTDDVSWYGADKRISWTMDPKQDATGGNISWLEKENGNIIITSLLYEDEEKYFLNISIANFITVIEQWKQLMQELPSQIIITMKDGVVSLEGKD